MTAMQKEAAAARVSEALEAIPYSQTLGITAKFEEDDFTLVMPFKQTNIGNPVLPALHGGAIGGFMEMAAICQLIIVRVLAGHDVSGELPKPIGINIDYLRRGKPIETYARAIVFKQGSRVANVRVEAWQEDADKPIAALHGHFLTAANAD